MANEYAEDDSSKDTNCSPLELAMSAMLERLSGMHTLIFPERDPGSFTTNFLEPHIRRERSAKEMRNWMIESEKLKHSTCGKPLNASSQEVTNRLVAYVIACGFYVKAFHASHGDRTADEAWEHLAESRYFYGYLRGRISVFPAYRVSMAGGNARHAENRAMKADIFTWLDSNMANFKSMDAAAEAATLQQPIVFRTARDWVGEWKKVRSASTP